MSADIDSNVSNGTCYFVEHTETKGNFIPCGNVALGHWPCCHAGDFCLSFDNANACWDPDTGNTYLSGCTDPDFYDPACPWKSPLFNTQEWVAIQQCHRGTGNNDTLWGGCKISQNSTELERLPHQSCDPYCTTYILQGSTALPAFASLPNSTGSSIAWTNGFEPTSVYNPITIATEISGTTMTMTSIQTRPLVTSSTGTGTQSITSTATNVPPATDTEGLSTGAKAGVGVGAAGALLLFVATVFLFLLFRRRRKESHSNQDGNPAMQYEPDTTQNANHTYPSSYQPSETTPWSPGPWGPQELAAQVGNDFKSELPANERPVTCELAADHLAIPQGHQGTQIGSYAPAIAPNSPYSTLDSSGTDQISSYSGAPTMWDGSRYIVTPEPRNHTASSQS